MPKFGTLDRPDGALWAQICDLHLSPCANMA